MRDLEISKMLTLSTAHITKDTNRLLANEPYADGIQLSVFTKADFGYFIYVNDNLENRNIPGDLKVCLELAKENGCKWLCLDCDGDTVEGLEEYDW